ncbi:uncharacterized protein BJX67DRAFT_154522 [Aspergillus lucknowensis]|uniref:Uncharacterized protein n=1 Tax=Aspergillus lucknowensis TaxID=176173 RepID=A0ABR4LQV0_9EURO
MSLYEIPHNAWFAANRIQATACTGFVAVTHAVRWERKLDPHHRWSDPPSTLHRDVPASLPLPAGVSEDDLPTVQRSEFGGKPLASAGMVTPMFLARSGDANEFQARRDPLPFCGHPVSCSLRLGRSSHQDRTVGGKPLCRGRHGSLHGLWLRKLGGAARRIVTIPLGPWSTIAFYFRCDNPSLLTS